MMLIIDHQQNHSHHSRHSCLPPDAVGGIGCFRCVSVAGSNPPCEDTFHNNHSGEVATDHDDQVKKISPFRVSLSCLAWLAVRVGAGLFLHRPASSWPAPMLILARLVSNCINWDVGNLVGKEGEEILTQFLPIEGDDGAWMLSWLRHPHHRHWADKDKQLWCFLLWREVHFMPRNT